MPELVQQPKTNDSLKKNAILNTVFRVLMIISPLLTAPYVSRVLLSDGVGIHSYTQSLSAYFTMFAALGTVAYGTREIARNREDKMLCSKAFWEIELVSVICSSISLVAWLILSFLYTEYKIYLLILSLTILATTLDISWFYAGLEKYKYTITINLIFKLLSVIFIFIFVKRPDDLWIYILIYASTIFLGNASMWIFLPRFLSKTSIEMDGLKRHLKETLIYFIPAVATSLYTILDKTLIGALIQGETVVVVDGVETTKKVSELESGYYEQATKIIDLIKTVTFVGINAVAFSRSSYLYKINDQSEIKQLMLKTSNVVMFLSIGAAFGLFGVSDTFVPLFFGDGYEKTAVLLKIMAALVPIICLSGTLGSIYYTPCGKRKQSSIFLIIGAAINIAISIPLVIFFKSIGASIATLVAELAISILYFAFCKGALTIKELFVVLWKKMLSGAIMLAVLLLFHHFLGKYIHNQYVFLLLLFSVGFLLYCLVLLLLKDETIKIFKNAFLNKIVMRKNKKDEIEK